jgi:hypothetical protein
MLTSRFTPTSNGKAHLPPAATHAPGRSLVMTFRSARGDCMMSWTAQNRAASAVTAIRLVQKTAAGRRLRPPDLFGQRYWAV